MANLIDIPLEQISDTDLQKLFLGAPITVLLGSGVSIWQPTTLISGADFAKSLFDLIFKDEFGQLTETSIDEDILWSFYKELPFEVINDRCPNQSKIYEQLCEIYNVDKPNPVHGLFANLLIGHKISSIITSNYDNCLDGALAQSYRVQIDHYIDKITRIIANSEVPKEFNEQDRLLFKIHGSAERKDSLTLVYKLEQEGMLEDWKRSLFHKLIKDHILFIVGYSGKDFDICQEIPLGHPKKVIWNFLANEDITPNSKLLEEKVEEIRILGDMGNLLSRIFQPIHLKKSSNKNNISNEFRTIFTTSELRLWQARLLNSLTYTLPAINLTKKLLQPSNLDPNYRIELLSELAGALAPSGKYRQAALTHLKAAKIARSNKIDPIIYFRQINNASDAFRGNGNILQANWLHLKLKLAAFPTSKYQKELDYLIARNEILLLYEVYRIVKALHMRPIVSFFRKMAERRIKRFSYVIQLSGNIYVLQQLKMWGNRFGISNDKFATNDAGDTPLPSEGYKQLYFPLGWMMDFRGRMNNEKDPLKEEVLADAEKYLDQAKQLGIHPEVWKLLNFIRMRFPSKFSEKKLIDLKQEFNYCEYTWIQRNIKRIFGY